MLRLLGFDTSFFTGENDSQMVNLALAEKRIILTRDTHILERRLVTRGRVKAFLLKTDDPEEQIKQVVEELHLKDLIQPFTLCLECNRPLTARRKEELKDRVPPYVWQTQKEYVECPECHRIYWKGTHWSALSQKIDKLAGDKGKKE